MDFDAEFGGYSPKQERDMVCAYLFRTCSAHEGCVDFTSTNESMMITEMDLFWNIHPVRLHRMKWTLSKLYNIWIFVNWGLSRWNFFGMHCNSIETESKKDDGSYWHAIWIARDKIPDLCSIVCISRLLLSWSIVWKLFEFSDTSSCTDSRV